MAKDKSIRSYYQNYNYAVEWLENSKTVRVYDRKYGCSINFVPGDYEIVSGSACTEQWRLEQGLMNLNKCLWVLPGYPAKPKPPGGKISPPAPAPKPGTMPAPAPIPTPSKEQPGRPEWMSPEDWQKVNFYASLYNLPVYLVPAIGWHETHWGRLGAGRQGYITGYGIGQERYRGHFNQIQYTSRKMYDWGVKLSNISLKYLTVGNKGGYPTGIYATDQNWPAAVWNVYKELLGKYKGKAAVPMVEGGVIQEREEEVEVKEAEYDIIPKTSIESVIYGMQNLNTSLKSILARF